MIHISQVRDRIANDDLGATELSADAKFPSYNLICEPHENCSHLRTTNQIVFGVINAPTWRSKIGAEFSCYMKRLHVSWVNLAPWYRPWRSSAVPTPF